MPADRCDSMLLVRRRRQAGSGMLCAVVALLLLCPAANAQPGAAGPAEGRPIVRVADPNQVVLLDKLNARGDLTLNNATLSEALFTISELWNVNFVVNSSVQGQVGGVFKDAPLREILDSILLSNGYSYRPVGQSLVVMPLSELGGVHPLFESATLPVPGGQVEGVVEAVKLLNSPNGRVQAIPAAGSLLVIDYPERIDRVKHLLASIGDQGRTVGTAGDPGGLSGLTGALAVQYFKPKYVDAAAVEAAIKPAMSAEGKLGTVPSENWVVMVDHPGNLRLAEEAFRHVDVVRPQVRITAYIYDISLEDMRKLGVNWNQTTKGRIDSSGKPLTLFDIDSVMSIPFDASSTGGVFTFANMSRRFDLKVMVNALDEANDSRLLADPTVIVMDNEKAIFESVDEIPYQQLTQTGQGGNIGTTDFRDAGIKLNVQPRISPDGSILMKVNPEFSRLAGFTPEDNQPIISRRTAETTLRVENGQTLVIGGLRVRVDVKDRSGVPFLKDLWLIGPIFRGFDGTIRESELVVFVRPEIVLPDEPPRQREASALHTTECHLDNIPVGEGCPPLPYCQQCYPGYKLNRLIQPPPEEIPNSTMNGEWQLRHQRVMERQVWGDRRSNAPTPTEARPNEMPPLGAYDSQSSAAPGRPRSGRLWRLPLIDEPATHKQIVAFPPPAANGLAATGQPPLRGASQPIRSGYGRAIQSQNDPSVRQVTLLEGVPAPTEQYQRQTSADQTTHPNAASHPNTTVKPTASLNPRLPTTKKSTKSAVRSSTHWLNKLFHF